jgi:hypothetical protein
MALVATISAWVESRPPEMARREIQQDGRAGERGICGRRDWRPEILANLHGDCEARDVGHVVHKIVAERHALPEQRDFAQDGVGACGELPLLVELAVIRQVCLGCDAEDTPAVDRDRTVEQFPVKTERRAHDEYGAEAAARRHDFADGSQCRFEQRVLMEQVFVGVGREAELGKERNRRVRVRGTVRQRHGAGRVVPRLCPRGRLECRPPPG